MARPTFVSPRSAGSLAIVALASIVVLDVVSAASALGRVDLLERIASHAPVRLDERIASDQQGGTVALFATLAFLLSALAFLRWFRVVHENIQSFGAVLGAPLHTPVAAWIIPIVSLYRPYQITAAIWDKSLPAKTHVLIHSRAILAWWWGLWLAARFASAFARLLADAAHNDARKLIDATWVSVGVDALDAAAAICAILVVKRINERQEGRVGDQVAAHFD